MLPKSDKALQQTTGYKCSLPADTLGWLAPSFEKIEAYLWITKKKEENKKTPFFAFLAHRLGFHLDDTRLAHSSPVDSTVMSKRSTSYCSPVPLVTTPHESMHPWIRRTISHTEVYRSCVLDFCC